MGAGQVALQIILDFEHARADRLRDRFADMRVEREFGRAPVQLEHPFDGQLDLLGRDGIAIFAHAIVPCAPKPARAGMGAGRSHEARSKGNCPTMRR